MKRLVFSLVAALAATLVLAASAGAGPPASVTITVNTTFGSPGTFTTTGGVLCPSGTTTDATDVSGRGQVGNFHDLKTFTCDDDSGTFTLHIEAHHVFGAPTDSGSWSIADGTGAYAGLQGSGTFVGTYSPEFSALQDQLIGQVH